MSLERLRQVLNHVRRTPLHPQWLLNRGKSANDLLDQAHGAVLDIGCADRWLEASLPSGCQYVGLDYPATGARLYDATPDVFADAANLPMPDATFDTVVMFEVLEHLKHPREAFAEAARVLRPHGKLLLTIPFLYPMHDEPYDFQRYTLHGLLREIEVAGMRPVNLEPALGSLESAALLLNLSFGGAAYKAIDRKSGSMLFVPFLLLLIPAVNILARIGGIFLPSWPPLTSGYQLVAAKKE